MFKDVDIPKLLYRGNINKTIIDSVHDGSLDGMTFEGVVCKTQHKNKPIMFKIKNKAWLVKLKIQCGEDDKLFKELQ